MTQEGVTDLQVTQIRIFAVDTLPFALITSQTTMQKLKEELSFSEVGTRPPFDGREAVVLLKGELRRDGGLLLIDKVEVDRRRVVIEVQGSSADGDAVYEAFLGVVGAVSNISLKTLRCPLIKAESTRCIAVLGFTFDSVFSPAFVRFLNGYIQKKGTTKQARASVRPAAVLAEITYEITDRTLTENKITLNPKQFTFAPLPGAPAESRKYVLSSPFDSATHLALIQGLNKSLQDKP